MQKLKCGTQYSPAFIDNMCFISKVEGGISLNVSDRGGYTKYGISTSSYPNLRIGELTQDTATYIYHKDYWEPNKCDHLSEPLALCMLDSSVNCGVKSAAKWLQSGCNALGSSLKVDGDVGPKTLASVKSHDPWKLYMYIISKRLKRYSDICVKDRTQIVFLRGWVNRVVSLGMYVFKDLT